MKNNDVSVKVRVLLASGKSKEALELLATDPAFQSKGRVLTLLQSELSALRQKELKGVIDPKDAQLLTNQLNDRILALLDEKEYILKTPGKNLIYLGGAAFILLLAIFYWFGIKGGTDCPAFDESKQSKVLILPFVNVGSNPAKPEVILQTRIADLTARNNLSVSAKVCPLEAGLSDKEEAVRLAQRCKAALVVWGQYSDRKDSIFLNLQYHFLESLEWNTNESLQVRDVTALQSGTFLKGLDDAVFSLCGLLAMRANDKLLTLKWIGKVAEKDSSDQVLMNWANSMR